MKNQKLLSGLNFIILSILVMTFGIAYFPVWKRLVMTWFHYEEYSHGFIILPLCLYIVWKKWGVLSNLPLISSALGFPLIVTSLLMYFISHFAEIFTVDYISLILCISGMILYLYGKQMVKELVFPLFFMLFMVPVPSQVYSSLTMPLQLFVSTISVWISKLLNIPIYREGNVIHLPDLTLQVVNACSGLRSMISLMAISAIFGYLTLNSNLMRSALFLSGIAAAIMVNIIRVLLMVMAIYFLNYDLTEGFGHTIFGMIIFFLALIILALTKGVLSIWDIKPIKE